MSPLSDEHYRAIAIAIREILSRLKGNCSEMERKVLRSSLDRLTITMSVVTEDRTK